MGEPKLRFKADDGSDFPDWEEKTLGEVFIEIKEKNRSELPVLSVQQGVGTVLRDSSERRITYNKNSLNNYKAMRKGDFIIHLRSFEGGLECSNHDGISSPAYRILRSNRILSDAFKDYFRSYTFIKGKLSDSVVGIRDGKNIDMPTFWEIQISIPSLPEQRKIADLLSAVDDVIAAQEAEVVAWEKRKKGVMQKLFSQEVRFKADDGSDFPDWEKMTLGDVGSVAMCKRVFKEQTREVGDVPFFKIGTFGGVPDAYISKSLFDELKSKYAYPEVGTILLSASGTIGRQVEYKGEDAYYQDSNIVWLEHDDTVLNSYLKQFYSVVKWQGLEGSTIKRLYNKTILDTPFYRPSLPEQRKIADCLALLDDVIAKAKDELDAWRELKKGLLQQMFV